MQEPSFEINSNSKKRSRASLACVRCRKKKIKCDETRPVCVQCDEAKINCEYAVAKKRGPRKGYVQILEDRLAQMEKRFFLDSTTNNKSSSDIVASLVSTDNNQQTKQKRRRSSHQSLSMRDDVSSLSSSSTPLSPIQLYDNSDLPPLDLVDHLVDLFFKYINSVFPFVHRSTLKKSIQDGTISRPLLYSVLAISARFSDYPSIRTNPPYLAGERFAEKAISLVNMDTLQPTLQNIQFWGIMSCLEYGRASGSKSWIYGGMAVRFCQELGFYKEETLSTPIVADDGSIDIVAMALRRRVFWSCLGIDKLSSAGTRRPQCIERSDCDANTVNVSDCVLLRDLTYHRNVDDNSISDDSLMDIVKHYTRIIEAYGEVNKFMNRAKSNSASIVWPPIPEFRNLDRQLQTWKDNLPDIFQFNQKNLDHHRQYASATYLNVWLCSHAFFCSSMMVLHRGSLAFSDFRNSDDLAGDLNRRIQLSIGTCRMCVNAAMDIFGAIKDLCGFNTLPYMGYSAYVFATVLMTSTFSGTPESCQKSHKGLIILFDLIDGLRPYWPMCERLASATKELIEVHQKIYSKDLSSSSDLSKYPFEHKISEVKAAYPSRTSVKSPSSTQSSPNNSVLSPKNAMRITNTTLEHPPMSVSLLESSPSTTTNITTDYTQHVAMPSFQQQQFQNRQQYTNDKSLFAPPLSSTANLDQRQQQSAAALSSTYCNYNGGNEIDFNSLEFLYDTGLFGQVIFNESSGGETTVNSNNTPSYNYSSQQQQPSFYQNMTPSHQQTYTQNTSTLQPILTHQQQATNNPTYSESSIPTSASKSLWN